MNGVLILAHGSRVQSTKDTLNTVVSALKAKLENMPLEIAYMEFCEENIHSGIKALAEQGVTEIMAVPYFLFEGIHIREDIPNEIEEVLKEYPNVKVTLKGTLGADSRLADILYDRIME